jgi:hypothetical protein
MQTIVRVNARNRDKRTNGGSDEERPLPGRESRQIGSIGAACIAVKVSSTYRLAQVHMVVFFVPVPATFLRIRASDFKGFNGAGSRGEDQLE